MRCVQIWTPCRFASASTAGGGCRTLNARIVAPDAEARATSEPLTGPTPENSSLTRTFVTRRPGYNAALVCELPAKASNPAASTFQNPAANQA
jgi:hypothetical protein